MVTIPRPGPNPDLDPLRLARRLSAGCGALRGLALRAAFVRERLRVWPVGTSVVVLDTCRALADAGDPAFVDTLMAISCALAPQEASGLRRRLTEAAQQRGMQEVAAWLRRWPPWRDDTTSRRLPSLDGNRPLTLGERKALARRADRRTLRRALLDPHPSVVEQALRHPALTEADVVSLAARRPVPPEVLGRIFASPRWLSSHRVRLTLLRNPWCPLEIALQIVPHLRRHELRDAAASQELDPSLRAACARAARRGRDMH